MKSFPLFALLLLIACSKAPPGPRLISIDPPRVSRALSTRVVLTGENIDHALIADLDRPSRSQFTLELRVRLLGPQTIELPDAQQRGPTEVTALVPAGLLLGRYTVELSTVRGVTQLPDALEVADCLLDCADAGPDGGDGGPDDGGEDGGDGGPADGGCFTWLDLDRDSWGDPDAGEAICADDAGTRASRPDDCRDTDPLAFPGAAERCNGLDDDCDTLPDPQAICPDDGGWVVRTDTGNSSYDWATATNYGPGKIWLAENIHVMVRADAGAFIETGVNNCPIKLTSSWANPTTGVVYLGSGNPQGAVAIHSIQAAACNGSQTTTAPVTGLQGFVRGDGGVDLFGALGDGKLIELLQGTPLLERPGFGAGVSVSDVQGASDDSLFAVGSVLPGPRPKVWRLSTDGGAFVDEGVESLVVPDQSLLAVWAVDDTLAYAVGSAGALLERSDAGWRVLSAADAGLRAVRAFGPGKIYAATGDGRLLSFDGGQWQVRYIHPTPARFNDITATSEDDLWIVGDDGVVIQHVP